MKLETKIDGIHAIVKATGRMDATWANHVQQTVTEMVRNGQHQIQLDAFGIDYLSSAGIRALLRMQRELSSVQGSFAIVQPSTFVAETLRMTGLQELLQSPQTTTATSAIRLDTKPQLADMQLEAFVLEPEAPLVLSVTDGWRPWEVVKDAAIQPLPFPIPTYGIGIGAAAPSPAQARSRFGEFLAAAGYISWLSADGSDRPDYIETSGDFVPTIHAIQALRVQGDFSQLFRFQPHQRGSVLTLSHLIQEASVRLDADAIAMVGLMEIEGLVGASLQRSPGLIAPGDAPGTFPQVRDWLSYCGERLHRQQQALVVAIAVRSAAHPLAKMLPQMAQSELHSHAHALVLPYRALPQGSINCHDTITTMLAELEPINLLHLIQDDRDGVGLGESAFIRGACWCGSITHFEEVKQ